LRSILQAAERIGVAALDEAQTGELRRLRRDAQTMLLLFNDLTEISRLDAGQLVVNAQSFELRAWMDETVARWREPAQRRGLAIDANVDAKVPPFLVSDARHLRHILDHLVSNAMRFTAKGEIKINCFFTAANLVLTVRDTGTGIPKDRLPTIFDTPYAVGEEPQARTEGSTGLGLAICSKLAHLLGGTLTVQSELGKGSSFALRVPVQLAATTLQG
jgi:signal transduction histidine kinase